MIIVHGYNGDVKSRYSLTVMMMLIVIIMMMMMIMIITISILTLSIMYPKQVVPIAMKRKE